MTKTDAEIRREIWLETYLALLRSNPQLGVIDIYTSVAMEAVHAYDATFNLGPLR